MKRSAVRVAPLLLIAFLAVAFATAARADGEAGLVVQHGDGTIDTYCVPFAGDSLSGDRLLARANVAFEQFNGLVCSVGANPNEGSRSASSFDSCTSKCSGGSSCTYWAFFTQKYGQSWVYSALGFLLQSSRDGDMQGWKWGPGGPNSAPAPRSLTFETVCGHAPRGGAVQPPAPTTQPTADGSTAHQPAPPLASPASGSAGAEAPPATGTVAQGAGAGTSPTTPEPAGAAAAADRSSDSGALIAFLAVAGALALAIVAALTWRRRHGA
jgi:hypothetical protein